MHESVLEALEIAAVEPGGLDRLMAGDTPTAMAVAGHLVGCASCTLELDRLPASERGRARGRRRLAVAGPARPDHGVCALARRATRGGGFDRRRGCGGPAAGSGPGPRAGGASRMRTSIRR